MRPSAWPRSVATCKPRWAALLTCMRALPLSSTWMPVLPLAACERHICSTQRLKAWPLVAASWLLFWLPPPAGWLLPGCSGCFLTTSWLLLCLQAASEEEDAKHREQQAEQLMEVSLGVRLHRPAQHSLLAGAHRACLPDL